MHRYYLTLFILFAPLLNAMQTASVQLTDQDCLSILTRILLNQQTDLRQGENITFCKNPYTVNKIKQELGSCSVSLQSCSTCRTITLQGSGMYLASGCLALYVKQISVSSNPTQ